MDITEKIQTELIGSDYRGVGETEEILSEICGEPITWYDTCIDDGADDDETEDSYVMKVCFSNRDDSIIIRIYYGNVTEEIGYVDVAETAN
jgi:hypothetical protein